MQNIKAKGEFMMVVVVIALVIIAGSVGYYVFNSKTSNTVVPATPGTPTGNGIGTDTTTAMKVVGQDPSTGASVAVSYYAALGGEPNPYNSIVLGATGESVSRGQNIDMLVNATGYHSVFVDNHAASSGSTDPVYVKISPNATVTLAMFNAAKASVGNAAAGTNLSTIAAGGAGTYEIDFTGTSQKSTNDMRCIWEATAGTNVSTLNFAIPGVTVTPVAGNPKPSSYTQAASSSIFVFDVSPITDALLKAGSVTVQLGSAKTIDAANWLNLTCLTKENFIDSGNGKVSYGIEDSLGTAKNMAQYKFSAYFK